jgi:hypothetical protein
MLLVSTACRICSSHAVHSKFSGAKMCLGSRTCAPSAEAGIALQNRIRRRKSRLNGQVIPGYWAGRRELVL